MNVVYLETSAVLHWLLGQSEAHEVREIVDQADRIVTSRLTRAEADRALQRAQSEGLIKEGDVRRLRGLLSRVETSWMQMAVSEAVLARVGQPFPVEPLRTLDAIHLATALEFATVFPELRVQSYDRRIRDNAESLGIA